MVPSVVVDVDCDAAEGGDLGGEFIEAGVVLSVGEMLARKSCEGENLGVPFSFVCFGHGRFGAGSSRG